MAQAATISVGNDVVTLINVFIVAPERWQALLVVLIEATVQVIEMLPVLDSVVSVDVNDDKA